MGPARKIKLPESTRIPHRQMKRYIAHGMQDNLINQATGSMPGVASVFRLYSLFCDLVDTPPIPPTEEAAPRHFRLW